MQDLNAQPSNHVADAQTSHTTVETVLSIKKEKKKILTVLKVHFMHDS